MTKAIAYARVSTEDQGRGWSLASQLQTIRDYAAKNGMEILHEFTDDMTGSTLNRPGLNRLRELLRNGAAQALIVHAQDRLSRKLTDLLILRDELQRQGIVIHFARQGRVLGDSAETRALDNVEAIFAEVEREKILERTERGRKGKIESGRYLGNGQPPFGYRVEGEGRTTQLVIDEQQAEVVRMIFRLFAYGDDTGRLPASAIARRLTLHGIPTPADLKKGFEKTKKREYAEWNPQSIYPLLRNSVYVGRFTNGRFIKQDGKRTRNGPGTTTIRVPPIVDEATWQAVQQRLDQGIAESPRRTKHEYLVARRLTCSCGYHLIGRPSVHPKYPNKAYLSYVCGGRKGNARRCDLRPISTPKLDAIVWEWMKEVLLNPEAIEAELREQSAHREEKLAELDVERERLYQRKVEIDNELSRLLELYTRGSFPLEMLETKAAEKRAMVQAIQEAIDHNERQRQTPLTEDHIAALRAFAEELQRGIERAEQDFTVRRRLVEVMDVRVQLVWENQELWLKFTSDLGEGVKSFASRSPYKYQHNTQKPSILITGFRPLRKQN